jgi:hypothetical protein
MFTQKFEDFLSSIFSGNSRENSYVTNSGTVLKLPLERTAIEQINYAKWLYGGRLDSLLNEVKGLEYAEDDSEYIKFNYSKNTFTFEHPDGWDTDEFYFLFDFLKEKYLDNGYRVTNAQKEAYSEKGQYKEIERYTLIDSHTNHLIKLEVISIQGQKIKIVGWGYPTDDGASKLNQPFFFKIVKQIFEHQY